MLVGAITYTLRGGGNAAYCRVAPWGGVSGSHGYQSTTNSTGCVVQVLSLGVSSGPTSLHSNHRHNCRYGRALKGSSTPSRYRNAVSIAVLFHGSNKAVLETHGAALLSFYGQPSCVYPCATADRHPSPARRIASSIERSTFKLQSTATFRGTPELSSSPKCLITVS